MKNVSAAMLDHLAGDATTLARCWKIVRQDGEVFAFTAADIDITLPDNPLVMLQVANTDGSFTGGSNDCIVTLPQNPTTGDLLIAFVSGVTSATYLNTDAWTVEASDYSDGYGFAILSRYVQSSDVAMLPAITSSSLPGSTGMAVTVQEITGVTGTHSIDVPYANIQYAFEALDNDITSGAFTPSDPYAFVVFGSSSNGFDYGTSAPTFTPASGLLTTDIAVAPNSETGHGYGYGCGHQLAYEQSAQITASYTPSSQFNYFIGIVGMNVPSLTYSPVQGFSSSAIESKDDMSVDNMEVQGIFNSESITIEDLRAGKFDFANVTLFVVNYEDITMGTIILRQGVFGEVISSPQGWFKVELRGMTQLLQQLIIELYGPECRADLGDYRCTMPIDPPVWEPEHTYAAVTNMVNTNCWVKGHVNDSYTDYRQYGNVIFQCTTPGESGSTEPTWNTTLGATTSDGGVVWTCVAAWTRTGTIASVVDPLNFTVTWDDEDSRDVDTWYQYGIMQFDTGDNAGASFDIKAWVKSTETMTTYVTLGYPAQVGDRFHVSPGCDKSISTCISKFDNVLNLRGEPYLPGNDFVFYYPNASGGGVQAG